MWQRAWGELARMVIKNEKVRLGLWILRFHDGHSPKECVDGSWSGRGRGRGGGEGKGRRRGEGEEEEAREDEEEEEEEEEEEWRRSGGQVCTADARLQRQRQAMLKTSWSRAN